MKRNNHYSPLFTAILFILLCINTIQRTRYKEFFSVSDYSIVLTGLLMFAALIGGWALKNKYDIPLKEICFSLILMLLTFSIGFYNSEYMDGFVFLQLVLLIIFILGSVCKKWSENDATAAGFVIGIVVLLLCVHWIWTGFQMHGFKSIFRNENYLGVLLFSVLFPNFIH
ncbi:hypothetical protein P5G51_004260 [Virgibacillus sp. 179-BFC.A HS]|uniref:Uncharacterized protein n=1 Tax=Tigheibacillus jepli TaxID=3035914 RepID=A0ABU5CEG1_9BACI|nr:hypothetical protein [Virgibacillus sp. 179-BFC.A HS]MDY0404719.1 hypothetical protein [Virgibacillus sp. 179-BFC.A HS]